ncbi:MAG: copper chaperone [Calditrichaeota bacterium]|nr:MAG: copper chaperone [Calditrichota bacterium]MBL1207214.1 copper chaperone [Calditrichota bacterium]NOG47047.1 heavy-metal-associated domain-containing protein [Calditrichota bacterium]
MSVKNLKIEGMSCQHCVMSLTKELSNLQELTIKEVNIGTALVEYETDQVSSNELNEAVEAAGFTLISK